MVWNFPSVVSISIHPVKEHGDFGVLTFQVRDGAWSVMGLKTVNACPDVLANPSSWSSSFGLVCFLAVLIHYASPALSSFSKQLALSLVLETSANQGLQLKLQISLLGTQSSNRIVFIILSLHVSLNPTFWVTDHGMLRNGPMVFYMIFHCSVVSLIILLFSVSHSQAI